MVGPDREILEPPKDSRAVRSDRILLPSKMTTSVDDRIIYADEIPVDEECLEIHDSPEISLTSDRLSPAPQFTSDDFTSPITPMYSHSDGGYESHGSPVSLEEFRFGEQQDDLNYLLSDLFPALT